jgi:hypothetical protein
MRFVLTMGRMTLFDFTLFQIQDDITQIDNPDVVVVHHYNDPDDDGEDKPDGPTDFFGKRD